MIRDRHPMRVARAVLQHMLGPAEWRCGVDDSVVAKERSEVGAERRHFGETGQAARQRDRAAS